MKTRFRRGLAAGTALAAAAAATLLAAAPASAATGLDPAKEINGGNYTFEFSPASGQWPASGAVPGLEFRMNAGCPTGTTQTRHLILDEDGSAFPAAQSIGELPKDLWSAIGATDSAYATVGFSDAVLDGGAVATLKASPGTYTYVVACDSTQRFVSQPVGDSPYFQGTLTATATGWSFEHTGGEPELIATELEAGVSGVSATGARVTATIDPATATGDVTFKNGGTTLGTVALSGGTASVDLTDLTPNTEYTITAEYAATETHAASSADVTFTTLPAPAPGGDGADPDVSVEVPAPGSNTGTGLKLSSKPGDILLTSNDARLEGAAWTARGTLGEVAVNDDRRNAGAADWTLSGELTTDFTGAGTIPASALSWSGATGGTGFQAGTLDQARTLATGDASAQANVRTSVTGTQLQLVVPSSAQAGSYTATLSLTLI